MTKRTPKKKEPESKKEGNKYDKIVQENLKELVPAIIRNVLGYKKCRLKALPKIKLQTTLEKEPDFLMIIYDDRSPNGRILHIEFEGQDEKIMDWRMAEYLGIIGKIHQMEIEQRLIYIGMGTPVNIKGSINHTQTTYCYDVHVLEAIDYKEFLSAEMPEAVIFAILANPKGVSPVEIIRLILERLRFLVGDSIAIRKFIKQLIMLSKKRNLRSETINQAKKMIGYQDYEDDILYIQGKDVGVEQGIEQGIEQGQKIKDIIAIRNMSKKKFDAATIAEVQEVSLEFVNTITRQLKKEAEIISLLKKKDADVEKIAKQKKVDPLLVKVIQEHLDK